MYIISRPLKMECRYLHIISESTFFSDVEKLQFESSCKLLEELLQLYIEISKSRYEKVFFFLQALINRYRRVYSLLIFQ